jgi:hypothetical protein
VLFELLTKAFIVAALAAVIEVSVEAGELLQPLEGLLVVG